MTAFARAYLERKITDPELREALTPDYPVSCKRPLISRDWLPTLTREPAVELNHYTHTTRARSIAT